MVCFHHHFMKVMIVMPVVDDCLHVTAWAIGCAGLFFAFLTIAKHERESVVNLARWSESERTFQVLFTNAPVGMAILDNDGRFLCVNDAHLKIVGYTREQLLQKTFHDITFSEDLEIAEPFFVRLRSGQDESCTYEKRYMHADGDIIWVKVSISALRNGQGVTDSYAAVIENIQKNKILLQELKSQGNILIEAQKVARMGSWTYDLKSQRTACSSVLRDMFGCKGGRLECGIPQIMSHIHPDDRAYFKSELELTLHYSQPFEQEFRLLDSDGNITYVCQRSTAILNEAGEVEGIMFAMIDVSAMKRAEEYMLQAQKLESLGVLAGGIAHDFNNILTIVRGYAEIIKMMSGDNKLICNNAGRIMEAVEKAAHISHELITFSKGGDPIKQNVNLNDLVAEAVKLSLHDSSVAVDLKLAYNLPIISLDANQITRVIMNLVINSQQAMPAGGKITVYTGEARLFGSSNPSIDDGHYLKLTLEDNGIGMSKEQMEKIFDPYFTTKQGGSGLGLSVVYSIVSKHGGHVVASSQINGGAKFDVYLPVSNVNKENVASSCKDISAEKNPKHILIMDDEKPIREILSKMLESFGYVVTSTTKGEEMLEVCKTREFDLYIVDLTIHGGMGGKEATEKLLAFQPNAKVVVSSGYNDDPAMANLKKYGFCACLPKPVTMSELSEIVSLVI